ncbi:MAG: phenylalanine--tRNA ligase subunit beta [Bradymonadia bacterium]
MKISLNWLRRYVDVDWSAEQIAERLTLSGTEVDGIDPLKATFDGVIVAKVLETRAHPNSDKLKIAHVDAGSETLDIVCGAPNCRAGLTVAFAQVGSRLPDPKTGTPKTFEIAARPVRDVLSPGMLCGEDEIGLSDVRAGIAELDSGLVAGQALVDALPIEDTILDVGVTANRGDCLSHVGIARELAAISGAPLKMPSIELPAVGEGPAVPVSIADAQRCAQYIGRVIRGLGVAPSPFWMRRLLEAVGVRSINNLVDVTNFVLFELGQPLHAFDLHTLRGPSIHVRTAEAGERLTTLDDVERTLTADDLVICDAEGPVALAGVMGGQTSEVSDETTEVFLESAWFQPKTIRMTSKRVGLGSESSKRFERSVDSTGCRFAADRAAKLFCELSAPGTSPVVVDAVTETVAREIPRVTVGYSPADSDRRVGVKFPAEQQKQALTAFGFDVDEGAESWQVTAPTWRSDVAEPADLVEEVVRFVGYDAIEGKMPSADADTALATSQTRQTLERERRLRGFLTSRGYHQTIGFSFHNQVIGEAFDGPGHLKLLNPISEELAVMRRLLAPRLVMAAAHNLRHGARSVALFELGKVFLPQAGEDLPREEPRLGIVLGGDRPLFWGEGRQKADFYDLKGLVEDLWTVLGLPAPEATTADAPTWLHPGATVALSMNGAHVGHVGQLHPGLVRTLSKPGLDLDLPGPLWLAELRLKPLLGEVSQRQFKAFSTFPSATRDLALVIPAEVAAGQVLAAIEELAIEVVDSAEIFDVYEGSAVGEGNRSVAISITFRAIGRTLTETDIQSTKEQLLSHLGQTVGAKLR